MRRGNTVRPARTEDPPLIREEDSGFTQIRYPALYTVLNTRIKGFGAGSLRQSWRGNIGRTANLKGAFGVSKRWNVCENVLLIDDIYTTGATVEKAAKMLKKAGCRNVYFLTISIGQGI